MYKVKQCNEGWVEISGPGMEDLDNCIQTIESTERIAGLLNKAYEAGQKSKADSGTKISADDPLYQLERLIYLIDRDSSATLTLKREAQYIKMKYIKG